MPREKNTQGLGQLPPGSAAALPDWMNFPTLSATFDPSPSKMIAYLTARQKEYESTETTGATTDRVRARLIAASYARTCALLQELETARAEFLKQPETESAETR
jgi:hypothetical protein